MVDRSFLCGRSPTGQPGEAMFGSDCDKSMDFGARRRYFSRKVRLASSVRLKIKP